MNLTHLIKRVEYINYSYKYHMVLAGTGQKRIYINIRDYTGQIPACTGQIPTYTRRYRFFRSNTPDMRKFE